MKTYSTLQVAKVLKLTSATLHRWIREKRIQAPPVQSLGGVQVRIWLEQDLERVRNYKSEHYWGKGTKKRYKQRKRKSQ
jgi:predicted DNA-binding transcriptional regulator AlpA